MSRPLLVLVLVGMLSCATHEERPTPRPAPLAKPTEAVDVAALTSERSSAPKRTADQQKASDTERQLRRYAAALRYSHFTSYHSRFHWLSPWFSTAPTVTITTDEEMALRDAWGRRIVFQLPGRFHRSGFDLISSGPDGIYEEGGGDDIVVGEDLLGGIAAMDGGR